MPRRPRTPKPKAEQEPLSYQLSDELKDIGSRLIRLFPAHFGSLANHRIAYAMITGTKAARQGSKIDAVATARKAPPLWRDLAGYDAVVTVNAADWQHYDASQREALVAHELSHLGVSEKGTLRLEHHDLEEFAWIARHYGQWRGAVTQFTEQLSLFDPKAKPEDTEQAELPEPEQGVIVMKRNGGEQPTPPATPAT
jgi:predicted metallopeptidase